jgi:hypothetical protein
MSHLPLLRIAEKFSPAFWQDLLCNARSIALPGAETLER